MGTKIEWTNATWNIITGCDKYSEGCTNCYAERMHKRLRAMGQKKYNHDFRFVYFHEEELKRTFGKQKKMVFVNSMSDTFHKHIDDDAIYKILQACYDNKPHIFQVLTKRAERLVYFNYPDNVWLGVTVENARHKDRIEYLKQTDAKVKFLSCEPLLGDLGELDLSGIDWVIVGGESGPNARPMHAEWIYNILHQCNEQKVPFFFKQWGEWMDGSCSYKNPERIMLLNGDLIDFTKEAIDEYIKYFHLTGSDYQRLKPRVVSKVGKKKAGCLIDGEQHKEYPRGFYGA